MAVRDDFAAGEVLAAADLNDTFAEKLPYSYGTATPSTSVDGFLWYDENDTPPTPKFWDGAAFQNIAPAGGLELVTTESFTTSSAVSVNGCFTSTYTNYKIIINFSASGTLTPRIRLRVGGSDNTGATSYRFAGFRVTASNTTAISPYSAGTDRWDFGGVIASNYNDFMIVEMKAPQATEYTKFMASQQADENFGSHYMHGGTFTATTSFDGFTFYTSANNVTGTLRVYGYKD